MNEKNLKNLTPKEAREIGKKGGIASVKARREKKTLSELLQFWAEKSLTADDLERVKSAGISETTNKALMLIPLINNLKKGDIKSLQLAIDLMGEDKKKDAEIKKLNEEIELLKLEQEKLKQENALYSATEEKIVFVNDVEKKNADN